MSDASIADEPVPEKGGYSAADVDVSELPTPPSSVTVCPADAEMPPDEK